MDLNLQQTYTQTILSDDGFLLYFFFVWFINLLSEKFSSLVSEEESRKNDDEDDNNSNSQMENGREKNCELLYLRDFFQRRKIDIHPFSIRQA